MVSYILFFFKVTYKLSSSSISGGAVGMKSCSDSGILKPLGISFLEASTCSVQKSDQYWHPCIYSVGVTYFLQYYQTLHDSFDMQPIKVALN